MSVIRAVHSELVKVKHTPFAAIHFCLPIIGALLFVAYYAMYSNIAGDKKLKLILEITATFFPLLISVVVGFNILLEEKASHFQILLAAPNRPGIVLAKLVVLYSMGILALLGLLVFFMFGIYFWGIVDTIQLGMLAQAAAGMAFYNLILYIFHLFLSFKFGLGISLFCGVFESLQGILYSNIELKGIWRYIPFAWSMDWVEDSMRNRILIHSTEWILITVLTTGSLFLVLIWFSHWEGRKNYE
ncbi:MAG: lantibiotic immunity ABC transporter MutG family permease subunit [Lachnospiraceae bacterium]|mgnify:CR=1 FL=1|nr:lantibiotic immunity ABC transporter MutG family permease subunit [Lachnospiraceae bacterium]